MHKIQSRRAALLAAAMFAAVLRPVAADAPPRPAVLEFDEIDHIFTTEAVPPPGSFRQHAGLVAPSAAAASESPKPRGVLATLGSASTVLGNASSVVNASGELGRALRLADAVTRLAPVTQAMGMAGGRRFDALLQTFVLPRVSPSGAVMLQGFLSAQTEYKTHFGRSSAGTAQATPPAELEPYAKGALRHYTVGSNGWVRIDDPSTNVSLVIKPDLGTSYVLDNGAKTVRTLPYAVPGEAAAAVASGTGGGSAAVTDRVESLGKTTVDGVAATGYRTESTVRLAATGSACAETTVTSTRVEYFAPSRVGSQAANMSPAQRADDGACNPSSTVRHAGASVPRDQLMLYQANTVEKKTAAGTDKYTVLIERGNVRERNAYDTEPFDIPAGFKAVSSAHPVTQRG